MKTSFYSINGPTWMRIAVVSDLHDLPCDAVLEVLESLKPDCIMVPGDLMERQDKAKLPLGDARLQHKGPLPRKLSIALTPHEQMNKRNGYSFLKHASQIAPVFYSIGNHEWQFTEEDRRIISENDVTLLDNTAVEYQGMLIGGLSPQYDEAWLEHFRKQKGYKMLLCHHPEYYNRLHLEDFDLVLAGHAHGGQIRMFGYGLYSPGQGFLPKITKGRYGNMIVSAGCANTLRIQRIGNREEIVLINMEPI